MFKFHSRPKSDRGLTLIELLVTISVLAIVAAIAVPVAMNVVSETRNRATAQAEADAKKFLSAYTESGAVLFQSPSTLVGYIDTDGDNIIDANEVVDTLTLDPDDYKVKITGTSPAVGGSYNSIGITSLEVKSTTAPKVLEFVGIGVGARAALPTGLAVGDILSMDAGQSFSVALKTNGTVVAWGTTGSYVNVPAGLSGVTQIASSNYHTLALKSDGTVVGWGGLGNNEQVPPTGLSGVKQVRASQGTSIALKNDGTVVCFGSTFTCGAVPAGIVVRDIVASGNGAVIRINTNGTLTHSGSGFAYQWQIPAGLDGNVKSIVAGQAHFVVLKNDGTVVSWGSNSSGQTNTPAGLTDVVAVYAKSTTSYALKSDGTIVAWGSRASSIPSTLSGVTVFAPGDYHEIAVTAN